VRAGREQVHDQQVDADVEGVHGLGGEVLDGPGAVLVGRRDDLQQGDESD
jgi:hypothetical protein